MQGLSLFGRRRYGALLLAAGVLAAGVHAQETKQTPPAPGLSGAITLPKEAVFPVTLPYRLWNGIATLDLFVNGITPQRLALDTGLNAITVLPAAAAVLEMPTLPGKIKVSVLDKTSEAAAIQIRSVRLGTITLASVPAASLDLPALLSRAPRSDAPTIWLGGPFLSAFQVTFDFSRGVIVFNKPTAPLPNVRGTVTAPLKIQEGRIYTEVTIPGGKPFMALVDTGTVGTLIPGDVADKLKLKPVKTSVVTHDGSRVGRAGVAIVPRLRVGKAEIKSVPVVFLMADAPPGLDRTIAVLGMDFLGHFNVTINYARQQMALSPFPKPEPPRKEEENPL
jgi:predicted aspartyl protease